MKFECLNDAHAEALLEFELNNRHYFERYIKSRGDGFYSLEGVVEHINEMVKAHNAQTTRAYVLLDNQQIVARANIRQLDKPALVEIGYRVASDKTGLGIATLSVKHLLNEAANTGVKSLSAYVMNNNKASEKVLIKNGFKLTLCLPRAYKHNQTWLHGFKYSYSLC